MGTLSAAHRDATRTPLHEIAAELQDALGQRLVAYAAGTRSPQAVGRWATAATSPREDAERRVRALYRVFVILREAEDHATIRAWLLGANPDLEDRAPLELLREDEDVAVFHAAEAFVRA